MAIKGLSHFENERYASRLDDAEDMHKTWWILGPLDVNCRAFIGDNQTILVMDASGGNGILTRAATRNLDAVRLGLKGVENFKDPSGSDIKLDFVDRVIGGKVYKVVSDEFISKIPPIIVAELGDKIMELNTFNEDLRKKLATQ